MKIPAEIVGRDKIRNCAICNDYIRGKTAAEIHVGGKYNLSVSAIDKIVFKNKVYVNKHIGWSKSKRLHILQKMVYEEAKETKKDKADLVEQIRKEIEGDKPLVDNSIHTHYTTISDEQLLKDATNRGVDIPKAIQHRITSDEEQPQEA